MLAGHPVFPKEQFAYPAWLPLLRDVGLVHRVTPPALAAAAEAVAGRAAALHMAVTAAAAAAAEGGGGVPDVASLDGEATQCAHADRRLSVRCLPLTVKSCPDVLTKGRAWHMIDVAVLIPATGLAL